MTYLNLINVSLSQILSLMNVYWFYLKSLDKPVAEMFQLYNKCREKSKDSKCNCWVTMNRICESEVSVFVGSVFCQFHFLTVVCDNLGVYWLLFKEHMHYSCSAVLSVGMLGIYCLHFVAWRNLLIFNNQSQISR